MFIGHFALGFAAKKALPRTSLAMLFVAVQLADILWPLFVAVGLERVLIDPGYTAFTPLVFVSYPFSHSLLMLIVWGFALAWLYRKTTGNGRVFWILVALVVSHWVLDVATHRPDMPLYPGGPKFGLGLWNSIGATLAVEVPMYVAGVWIYLRATRARDAIGRWAFWSLVVVLLVAYFSSISSPPPSVTALYASALGGIVLGATWSWWADRHRESIAS